MVQKLWKWYKSISGRLRGDQQRLKILSYRHPDVSLVWGHTSVAKSSLKCLKTKQFLVSIELENWSDDYLISLCRANDYALQGYKSSVALLERLWSVQYSIRIFRKSKFDQILFLSLSWFCFWNRETSDLLTCVADLQYKNQKLQEENNKLKLTLEAADETNSKLVADNEKLHQQVKR